MVDDHGGRWLPQQLVQLRKLVTDSIAQDVAIDWRVQAPLLGHSAGSCKVMACAIRKEICQTLKATYRDPRGWPAADAARMRELVIWSMDRGMRINWSEQLLNFPGHTLKACQMRAHTLRKTLRAEREKAHLASLREQADRPRADEAANTPPPAVVVAVDPPFARATSTDRLTWDSYLRGRIAAQGVTAGLLGDPPPGRSALDQRRAGGEP